MGNKRMTKQNSYLEKQYNTYFAVLRIPVDVQRYFQGKTRLSATLKTSSLGEANRLKWPYIEGWKANIELARRTMSGDVPANVAEQAARYALWLRGHQNGPEEAKSELFGLLDETVWRDYEQRDEAWNPTHRQDVTGQEKEEAYLAYSMAIKEWTGGYVEEYLKQYEAEAKTKDEARRALKTFSERFPHLEEISRHAVEDWVEDMLESRSRPTIKKRIGFIRGYWNWCSHRKRGYFPPENPFEKDPLPQAAKSKQASSQKAQSKRPAFTREDYSKFLDAARDQEMQDFTKIAAHTGCRISEIMHFKLQDVAHDRFNVEDAKSESGWREIPIHNEIKPVVERLVANSTDGFLFTGQTSNKYGKRTARMGKRFVRLIKKVGIYKSGVGAHSFRRSLATMMLENGVEEPKAAAIIGHEIGTMTYGIYAGGISFAEKNAIIQSISYDMGSASQSPRRNS
tara:strand:+ start:124 stop:1488 length:1365 start_codon:yes stop_codon:yes gene_type:complete